MVRTRTPRNDDKSGLRKGTWTPEEDKKLVDYITRYGHWNWRLLPRFAGLARCGKSCRLRWLNYLRPNLKRGNYTQEEDETIVDLNRRLGNRWSAIAAQMPGRTDNEIKNHWHTKLKKRFQQNAVKESQVSRSEDQPLVEPITANNIIGPFPATSQFTNSSPFSHHSSSSESSSVISTEHSTVNNLVLEDGFAFVEAADTFPVSGNFWLEPYMLDISCVPSEPDYFSPPFDAELWSHDNY